MVLRNILLPVDGGPAVRCAIALAFTVARDFACHLEALHVRADPKAAVPLLGEGMSGAMIEEMIALAAKEADDSSRLARTLFDEFRRTYLIAGDEVRPGPDTGLSATWNEETGREDEVIARHARLCDLSVVSRPGQGDEGGVSTVLNATLFESGRPVLVAPPETPSSVPGKVAVAWNGSAEAARAVAAAMPLLVRAEGVYVLSAETDATLGREAGRLVDHLAWHGVGAEAVAFSPAGHTVGEATLLECKKLGCGMLVMGAYTHNRLYQMILGGVTSHVLAHAEIPVLMAH